MKVHGFEQLTCPLEKQPLVQNLQGWQCLHGHQFDRAKQGYVNLLPVQHKRSLNPGDNKEMVRARKNFLDTKHYAPVASTLSRLVVEHVVASARQEASYLDAGCGEGYYLNEFITHTQAIDQALGTKTKISLLGLDISKWAIQAAAKRTKSVQWVVGSNAHLPVADVSFDVVSVVFGFPVYEEFARILKPLGLLIVVEPTPRHLHELRALIYPEVTQTERPKITAPPGFEVKEVEALCFQINLNNNADILDLLAMTPHVHRITPGALAKLKQVQQLTVTVDMQFVVYMRVGTL
ncbi:MAG TPA: methyltransferase domain-containing protein [Aliidiomarina sp.]|nr:methyltransferase domain-containing protein [Aliidiomarina sp.]